ncbi:MAG: protein YgfX [Azonexus sp.]|jgi:toxin CptA
MQFPIVVGLRRSRVLTLATVATALVGILSVSVVPWPLVIRIMLGAVTVLMAIRIIRALSPRVETLRIDGDGHLTCQATGASGFVPAHLLPGATVHPWLTVLRLAIEDDAWLLVVVPGSVAPEEFRRLRVWLRWRAVVSDVSGVP